MAAARHGVVSIQQLLAAGLDRRAVSRRVAAGRLHRVHRGVYAVGHPALSLQGRYLAAVLACGEGAVLSCAAAAYLLRLVRRPPPAPIVTALKNRRVPGVEVHRARRLHLLDHSVLDGIPLTTVPRTLLDLARVLSAGDLARACHEAHVHHRTTPAHVEAAIARAPTKRGIATLRAILHGDHRTTLSPMEDAFLALLARAGLPLPQTNRPASGDRVDCRWPEHRLVVELDSYRFHATRHQWEEDRRRERRARAAGHEHRRYSWGDVVDDPGPMLSELAVLLVQGPRAPVKKPRGAADWDG